MSPVRIGGIGVAFPNIAPFLFPPAAVSHLIDATGEKVHLSGRVWWSDFGTHDITGVRIRIGAITSGGGSNIEVSLQDTSTSAGPPPRGDAVKDQSVEVTLASLTQNSLNTFTLSSARSAVAHGTRLTIVVQYGTGGRQGSDALNVQGMQTSGSSYQQGAYQVHEVPSGTFLATGDAVPNMNFVTSDSGIAGYFLQGHGGATFSSVTFNNGDTPDEVANSFQLPLPVEVAGMSFCVAPTTNGANFDVQIYDGTTPLEVHSIDANQFGMVANTRRWYDLPFASTYRFNANQMFRLSIKPTTVTDVITHYFASSASDMHELMFGSAHYWDRTDGGAWSNENTQRFVAIRPLIVGFDGGYPPMILRN